MSRLHVVAVGAALLATWSHDILAGAPPLLANAPAPAPPEAHSPRQANATVPMRVEVLSATSFVDIESRQLYRLYGMDACDARQTATLGKQTWPCGIVAMAWLVTATLNKWVACTTIREQDDTRIARCATGDLSDIAAEMLKIGYAITLPAADDRLIAAYSQHEKDARNAYRGLWASSFQMPWIFRQQQSTAQPKAP